VNVISWLERASLFTFPKHTHNINGLIGNVHYRQLTPNWGTIGKPGGPMAGSLARQILASEDEAPSLPCAKLTLGSILDARIAGLAAGWSKASLNSSAAGRVGERQQGNHRV
jgi:hypothetical protein